MKELKDLNILVFFHANNFSLSSHVPLEAVKRRLKKLFRLWY